ncbi:tRNA (guanosine(46)-N(7))-methyltransferase TrmB [Bartonella sp. DGB1]|uniref:tRNA (guanine(46)-N(7))-methyltransferase TrmB n=1 Tax=Bartonella sp. DGB1 TaxID=3239807 RepID=UPI00352470F2
MTDDNLLTRGFFGRRKGRPLGLSQKNLSESLLPDLLISINEDKISNLQELFPITLTNFQLEIGFGGGEHLLHRMQQNPTTGFIGVEPFINGIGKLLSKLELDPNLCKRLRLYNDDAVNLLNYLPSEQLSVIDLLYPDPWPKKRHWKRRFLNKSNLDHFARLLKKDGIFRFASDIESYVTWTLAHINQNKFLHWQLEHPLDYYTAYPGWISTRYEQKALREGRTPHYLTFRKS